MLSKFIITAQQFLTYFHKLTILHAGEGQSVQANQVIMRSSVVVLHHKPHQSQFRHENSELEFCVPHRIETCNKKHFNDLHFGKKHLLNA